MKMAQRPGNIIQENNIDILYVYAMFCLSRKLHSL